MSYGQYGGQSGGYGAPPREGYGRGDGYGGGGGGGGGGYGGPPGDGYGPPSGAPPAYGSGGGGPGAGGFTQQYGPPPGSDPQLWSWFTTVDADRSGAINAKELERALINGDWTPFDLDTVKLLITMFDTDRSGTIGFAEFSGLWKYIEDWQSVFKHFDRDRSGTIDSNELTQALQQFGYNLSPHLLNLVQRKYDPKGNTVHGARGPPPGITFDRFVRACVVIKQLSEAFRHLDTDGDNWVQLNYDQFMETVLRLP